jgi:hypothetical protein
MASSLSPTPGDGGMTARSDESGVAPPPVARRERSEKRSPSAPPEPRADIGARTGDAPPALKPPPQFDPSSSREALIATAAYYRAEKRGFDPGYEQEDWLAAEREVDGAGDVSVG